MNINCSYRYDFHRGNSHRNSIDLESTSHAAPARQKQNLHVICAFILISLCFFFQENSIASVSHTPSDAQHQENITNDLFNETTLLAERIWAKQSNRFLSLYKSGNYEEAHTAVKLSYEIALNNFGFNDVNTADSLLKLGIINQTLGNLSIAEGHLLDAIAILETQLSADHPDVAVTATNLANVYFEMRRFRTSEKYHQMALRIRENAFGVSDPTAVQSIYNLAVLYENEGNYSKAESHYQTAIESWSASIGPTHPYVGNALGNLTNVYAAQEKYHEAENILLRTVAYKKSVLGAQHQEVAQTLISLGTTYLEQGKYTPAGNVYAEALNIAQQVLNPADPQLALLMYTLANIYHMQARMAENTTGISNSAIVSDDAINPNKEPVNTQHEALESYAAIANNATNQTTILLEQALPLYEKAADILDNEESKNGSTLDVVLAELAMLYKAIGNTDMAIATESRLSTHY